ncbi:hypothetical protein HK097_009449 [Rhizophlyctis rosea]|uniref:Uncharacterized protein n=1 Tax=Rhizophlyctis rosea TaxID=64517 RepID=A0AAD5X0F9_9FUNG|nr:hypothetical protein HK097_009449 [Rhizophlyctis rosea]
MTLALHISLKDPFYSYHDSSTLLITRRQGLAHITSPHPSIWIPRHALVDYLLLFLSSNTTANHRIEMTLHTLKPSKSHLASHRFDIRVSPPAPLLERWSEVREWHMTQARTQRENRGEPPITGRAAIETEERMIRQRHSETLQEFLRTARSFEDLESMLERTLKRYVNVLFSVLNKHDDTPLNLSELSYLACSETDRATVRSPSSISS